MGFKMEYRLGNRRVSQAEWERHMFDELPMQLAQEGLQEQIDHIRCPVHGRTASIQTPSRMSGTIEGKIEACCEDQLKRVQRALGTESG